MRERNRRAREYSRRCRTRRLCKALWVVALVLWIITLAFAAWAFSLPKAEEAPAPSLARESPMEETGVTLVCTVTGYCACCTPYSHMNQRDGLVLTASGQWVAIGEAVAVDPEVIPLGSKVTLGGKTYIAADTGVYGYTVDVLMSHEDAQTAGAVRSMVTWEDAT